MRWAEMTVTCAPEASDAVSYAFVEAGCGGVMLRGNDPVFVSGSLPVSDELTGRLNELRIHLHRLPEFGLPELIEDVTLRYVEEDDWANAWKQYFKPMKIGKRIVIKPSWEEYTPEEDEVVLELDPGMAFGTGGHPTTRLCLSSLEDYVKPGMTVGDIGTGSGILSLAAAKLGAAKVYATDIDLLPRKIALENVERNALENIITVMELEPFDAQAQECDLIVSNIVANTIIHLARTIAPRLKSGGIFISSGIVEEHENPVKEALTAVGLTPIETRREDIWVSIVARRDPEQPIDSDAYKAVAQTLPLHNDPEAWSS